MINWDFISNGLSLYMDIVYLRLTLPVNSFLNIVFAIETFHKFYYHPGRMYLVERLIELIESERIILSDYISDIAEFCQKVVAQRNYLSHNHSEPSPAISDQEYYYYTTVLKMLFEIVFLKKLSLSDDSIKVMIFKNFMYKQFKR